MGRIKEPWLVWSLFMGLLALPLSSTAADFHFTRFYVDLDYGGNGRPGWVRAGDMDNDGDLDIVAGGGYALFVYENQGQSQRWKRHGNLDSTGGMGSNGAVLYDVDADGDLDVVCGKYRSTLDWWENPGGRLGATTWQNHILDGGSDYFIHDIVLADLDGDGASQEFVFNLISNDGGATLRVQWFKPGTEPAGLWEKHVIEPGREHGNNNHAGLDVGDVDGDGDLDIAYSNGWYEAAEDPRGAWIWHPVTGLSNISNSLLRDMDGDGDLDLIVSSGHGGEGVHWLAAPDDPRIGGWRSNVIDAVTKNPEGLAVLDIDLDGDLDVVVCDLDFDSWDKEIHNVYIMENRGDSVSWAKHNIAPDTYPSHLLQTVDVNQDGRVDILSESAGYKVVSYYENASSLP